MTAPIKAKDKETSWLKARTIARIPHSPNAIPNPLKIGFVLSLASLLL